MEPAEKSNGREPFIKSSSQFHDIKVVTVLAPPQENHPRVGHVHKDKFLQTSVPPIDEQQKRQKEQWVDFRVQINIYHASIIHRLGCISIWVVQVNSLDTYDENVQ